MPVLMLGLSSVTIPSQQGGSNLAHESLCPYRGYRPQPKMTRALRLHGQRHGGAALLDMIERIQAYGHNR